MKSLVESVYEFFVELCLFSLGVMAIHTGHPLLGGITILCLSLILMIINYNMKEFLWQETGLYPPRSGRDVRPPPPPPPRPQSSI